MGWGGGGYLAMLAHIYIYLDIYEEKYVKVRKCAYVIKHINQIGIYLCDLHVYIHTLSHFATPPTPCRQLLYTTHPISSSRETPKNYWPWRYGKMNKQGALLPFLYSHRLWFTPLAHLTSQSFWHMKVSSAGSGPTVNRAMMINKSKNTTNNK